MLVCASIPIFLSVLLTEPTDGDFTSFQQYFSHIRTMGGCKGKVVGNGTAFTTEKIAASGDARAGDRWIGRLNLLSYRGSPPPEPTSIGRQIDNGN